jgi:photosystem II stability/assembly factor-like uncharacterized protein
MKKRSSYCSVFFLLAGALAAAPFPEDTPWTPSNGPPGGVINVLTAHDSSLYAGSNQGLYKSIDGGASWRLTGLPLSSKVVSLAVVDGVVLAGTQGDGVFRSVNGGDDWTPADQGLPQGASLYAGSLTASNFGVLALVNGLLYVSVDDGRSWTPRGTFVPFNGSLLAVGDTLYGTNSPVSPKFLNGGVFRSDNGGATWVLTSESLSSRYVHVVYFSNGFLYAATDNGIYRSSDQGAHWIQSGLEGAEIVSLISVETSLYAGSYIHGVFKSDDDGGTWIPTGHPKVALLSLTSLGSELYSGTYFGIYRSDDRGDSWVSHNAGLANTYVYGVWAVGSDVYASVTEGLIGFGQEKLYRSSDSGMNWTTSGDGLPLNANVDSLVSDGSALYAGIFGLGVYRSTNGGAAWSSVGAGLPVVPEDFYTLVARSGLLLVAIANQIFRSTDAGLTWSGPSTGLSTDELVTNMAFAGNAVYAGTTSRVVKSIDGGASWQATGLQVFIRLVAASAETVYAVTAGSGVLKTTNGGDSWTPTALARNDIYSFAASAGWLFAANFGNALGAGQKGHVFVSDDEGESWTAVDQGLFLSGGLGGVYLAASDKTLYAGTQGYGVQTLKLLPDRESIRPAVRPHSPRIVGRFTVSESE